MARRPSYDFERREREKAKAAKVTERVKAKTAKVDEPDAGVEADKPETKSEIPGS